MWEAVIEVESGIMRSLTWPEEEMDKTLTENNKIAKLLTRDTGYSLLFFFVRNT